MNGGARSAVGVPSMLDLIHLSRKPIFPPGGVELYRQIALLTGMSSTDEVLVVPSGLAVTLEYFVGEHGVHGSGVEGDSLLFERAEERLRTLGLLERVHVQPGGMDALPFRDGIFDVVVAELGLTSHVEPEVAVAELIRVAKPGAAVVIVQPVWRAPVNLERRAVLSDHLGCRPLMLVEWKKILRAEGLVHLHTENWSDEETAFRPQIAKPFPDFAELFSLGEKLGILRRARRRWGWSGLWTAMAREREVHRVITRERILGLDLIKGVKGVPEGPPTGPSHEAVPSQRSAEEAASAVAEQATFNEPGRASKEEQVTGLPLFGDGPADTTDDDQSDGTT
jgi:SAM-dependent methyltransferase